MLHRTACSRQKCKLHVFKVRYIIFTCMCIYRIILCCLCILELSAIDQAKKKAKEKKKKEQTPVVGDIGALGDALPTLDLLLKKSTRPVQQRYMVAD